MPGMAINMLADGMEAVPRGLDAAPEEGCMVLHPYSLDYSSFRSDALVHTYGVNLATSLEESVQGAIAHFHSALGLPQSWRTLRLEEMYIYTALHQSLSSIAHEYASTTDWISQEAAADPAAQHDTLLAVRVRGMEQFVFTSGQAGSDHYMLHSGKHYHHTINNALLQ